MMCNCKIGT